MKCEQVAEYVDRSIDSKGIPFLTWLRIGLHLLLCSHCRKETTRLQRLYAILPTLQIKNTPSICNDIMKEILKDNSLEESGNQVPVSYLNWLVGGIILFLSLIGTLLTRGTLAIVLTLSIILTVYGALFIGSHLKKFSEKLHLLKHA